MVNLISLTSRRSFLKLLSGILFILFSPLAFAGKKIALDVTKLAILKASGDGMIVNAKDKNLLLIKKSVSEISVFEALCTHKGCALNFQKEWKEIRCSCHGSKFTPEGKVLNGPATKDLKPLEAILNNNRLIITLE